MCISPQPRTDAGDVGAAFDSGLLDSGGQDLGFLDQGFQDLGSADQGAAPDSGSNPGPDAGPPCVCETPPPDECVSGDSIFRTYQGTGTCDATGACVYPSMDIRCPSCTATCLAPCQGVTCPNLNGGCQVGGFCMPSDPGQPAECIYQDATDGVACTLVQGGNGTCAAGQCVQCTSAADCDDNNQCTADSCSAGGQCQNSPRGGSCNDSNACTLGDTCMNGQCTPSSTVQCNSPPGQCYGSGSCNPNNGQCNYPPSPSARSCNDGNACTHTDRCDGAGGCDGVAYTCTGGSCSAQTCDGLGGCTGSPTAPTGLSPSGGAGVGTMDVTLSWSACTGASSYDVEIQYRRSNGTWSGYFTYMNEPTNSKTFFPCSSQSPQPPCNSDFRFRVRAFDGSFGPWSSYSTWRWNNCRAC